MLLPLLTLALALAAPKPKTATDPEDIPLQAIGPQKKKDAPPPPSEALVAPIAPAQRRSLGLLIAPKIGGEFGLGGALGAGVLIGAEIGYRLPFLRRLFGLSLEASFSNPGTSRPTELGLQQTSTVSLSFPVLASANVELGPGLLRIMAGPSFEWWKTDTTVASFQFHDGVLALAAAAGIGYGIHLGPGAIGVELRYKLGLPTIAGQATTTHALGLAAAYYFLL